MKRSLFSHCRIAAGCLAISLAANSAHAQTLTVTTNLQLWLKADAGVTDDGSGNVLSWADQSPSPDAASQIAAAPDVPNTPKIIPAALNGKPVMRFDGVDDYLIVPDTASLSITGDITTFFVVKFDDFATFRAVWAKTQGNLPAPTDFYIQPGSGFPQVYRGDGTNGQLAPFQSTVALTAETYQTVGFAMEDTTCSHFIGGSVTSSGVINVIEGDTDAALLIGTRGDLFTKMKGDIAEILIYDRALTPAERASVASYLGIKYGIANEPPTVSLSAIPAGPSHPAGTTLTLTAAANDTDGTISNVKFFANGTLIGTATAPPYSIGVTLETAGSYTFTATATDDRSGITNSAPVVRTATGGAPPVLVVTSTLQLWLKADAGVTAGAGDTVLSWADQSGHANDAVAIDEPSAPIVAAGAINGLPAIRFDGVDDSLQVADSDSISITGDITSFYVIKVDDFGTFRAIWGKTAGNQPAPTDIYTLPGSGIPRVFRGNGAGGNNVDAAGPLHAGSTDLVGFSIAGSSLSHFLNGFANGSGIITTNTADTDAVLWIGTRGDQFTRMKGDIAEVLIYDSALSAGDLHDVQLYLAGKYGVATVTPVNTAPSVTITAPSPGGTGVAPVDVIISANAGDTDGSVVKVEFIVNGGVAATDLTSPFSASVNFPVATVATIVARATDNLGAVTVSAPITFTVTSPEPNPLPDLAHLRLWLRGDKGVTETSGVVSAWNDQSGSFNNATQPTASQRPTLVPNAI
ncbi:MAG: Ig-like domain-containing protein, partial [Chthoniobacteraceae bacterium]